MWNDESQRHDEQWCLRVVRYGPTSDRLAVVRLFSPVAVVDTGMRTVTITEVMTLDGVAQAPGRPRAVLVGPAGGYSDLIGVARSVRHLDGGIR